MIGSSASARAFQASQSAFIFRDTRLTVSLLTGPTEHRGERPTHPTAVSASKTGACNQPIGPPGSPLVSPQRPALPLARLALRGVVTGARPGDLHPTESPDQRARSVATPVAGDIASPIGTLLLRLRPAAIARTADRRLELGLDHRLDELAHTVAQTGLDRVKPHVEKINLRRRFRQQAGRVCAIAVMSRSPRRTNAGIGVSIIRRLRHL